MFSKAFGKGVGFAAVVSVVGFGGLAFSALALAEETALETAVEAADPTAGQSIFRRCAACHTVENGGPTRVGPNLWGIVDRDIGAVEGFRYSRSMAASEETWSLENLDGFIQNPRAFVPGTTMGFAGLRNEEQRASLLAYLQSLSNEGSEAEE